MENEEKGNLVLHILGVFLAAIVSFRFVPSELGERENIAIRRLHSGNITHAHHKKTITPPPHHTTTHHVFPSRSRTNTSSSSPTFNYTHSHTHSLSLSFPFFLSVRRTHTFFTFNLTHTHAHELSTRTQQFTEKHRQTHREKFVGSYSLAMIEDVWESEIHKANTERGERGAWKGIQVF